MSRRILIIEDETDIREAMEEATVAAGFEVLVAENGEIGLTKALSEKPDIILLDIVMPIMDGHEFLRRLRMDPWGATAKVIALTSMDDVENITNAHYSNIVDYVIKAHHSLDEIMAKIRLVAFTD